MISGKKIFKMHDAEGLPLSDILEELRIKKMQFDVKDWMLAAFQAGWMPKKTINYLLEPLPSSDHADMFPKLLRTYELMLQDL